MATTLERITRILVEQLQLPPDIIRPEARLAQDLGLESAEVVELTLAIEAEFGIEIADTDLEKAATLADLVALAGAAP